MSRRPNVLVILTDQLRQPPPYESAELRDFRREHCPGQERLRQSGVSFKHHYPMAIACAPSRASLLTGQYPSLHGVTQTDGLAKNPESDDMYWLAPDTVPTLGDWFRAGGYRTFFKGKWHASHAYLDAHDGDGYLLSIDDDGEPIEENIAEYLKADLLDDYGFSEWVGPEPHGLGKHNMGTVKDPFTADETIDLLGRLDAEESDRAVAYGLLVPKPTRRFVLRHRRAHAGAALSPLDRAPYRPVSDTPRGSVDEASLSTKHGRPWSRLGAPQPWNETHLKFYYQLQATVGEQITRVLDALQASGAYEDTIVVFSSDHGDMQGAHGGMHEKWHNAYEEALNVPFIVSSPLLPGGARELDVPTNHADLIPTLLGLAGIEHDEALAKLALDHADARPLVGRDLSEAIRALGPEPSSEPVLFMTDDEISEGTAHGASPFQRVRARHAYVLDDRAAQSHRDGHSRGRGGRRAAPREALAVPRQSAVLDGPRRAR